MFLGFFVSANFDLFIEKLDLLHPDLPVVLGSNPRLEMSIWNRWPDSINTGFVWTGFVECGFDGNVIFRSLPLNNLNIALSGFYNIAPLILPNIVTQNIGQVQVNCSVNVSVLWLTAGAWPVDLPVDFEVVAVPWGRFDLSMNRSIRNIRSNLQAGESALWTQWVINFIRRNVLDLLIPIVILVAVVVAMVGFYQMMFADSAESMMSGMKYIWWWILGIIIMMSAWYLSSDVLFDVILDAWEIRDFNGVLIAQSLYSMVAFPFIKMIMYLALWVLFVIVLTRVINYIFSQNEDVKKQALTLIAWNVIWMIIIIASRQIIELILGREEDVLNPVVLDLWDVWDGILTGSLPILYTVINRVMWLAAFVILVVVIYQSYMLLVYPTSEDNLKNIKNSFLYIAIWILVIWTAYVISNLLIVV